MTALLAVLLAAGIGVAARPSPPPSVALPPGEVLSHYTATLAATRSPAVLSFEYAVEQTGMRNDEQLHRVFRSGDDERDELLAVDGKPLEPPTIRIFRGRRDRYTLTSLAPRTSSYAFHFIGTHTVGRHVDYVFATTPLTPADFRVTQVTIDGGTFVPTAIAFETSRHDGRGSITFLHVDRYWVPLLATARGTYGNAATTERIAFMHYQFPPALPSSTFATSRLPPESPADEDE